MSRRHRAPLDTHTRGHRRPRPGLRPIGLVGAPLLTAGLLTAGLLIGAGIAGADPVPPPSAPTITAPVEGSSTSDATPSFRGTGEDGDTVTVSAAGASLCTARVSSGLWICTTAELADGHYVVSVHQVDPGGQQSPPPDPAVSFTVDTVAPPAPVIRQPAPGALIRDPLPVISGSGEDGDTVFVGEHGVTICIATVSSGSWACTPLAPLPDGAHALTATQTDLANNTSSTSAADGFTVDATAPAAPVITAPADGVTTTDRAPTISGTGETGAAVTVSEGTAVLCATTVAATGWSCTSDELAAGSHAISAVQVDASGNVSATSSVVTFTVAPPPAPPAPAITSPADGALTADGAPTVAGTGQPGATVTVLDGDLTLCTATVDGAGGWSCSGSLGEGTHSLTARQANPVGQPSQPSGPITLTVDTTAPAAPAITRPADGTLTRIASPLVSGTGENGATVTVLDGGAAQICTATVAAGDWSCVPGAPLADGRHALTARQADAAGNVSPASVAVTVTVDAAAPAAPVIIRPADGSVVTDATPRVSGTGENGATVVVLDGGTTRCTARVTRGSWSCDSATLRDGTHQLTALQTDRAGNVSAASDPVSVTVDTRHGGHHGGWGWGWWWLWLDWSRCFNRIW